MANQGDFKTIGRPGLAVAHVANEAGGLAYRHAGSRIPVAFLFRKECAMFTREQYATAIRVHERVYAFVAWLRAERSRAKLHFDERHVALNEFDAARRWLVRNADVIPAELQPAGNDADAFVNMLVSFGMTSWGATARERKPYFVVPAYDPTADHCTCRFCRDLVPRLGNRSWYNIQRSDKDGARLLKLMTLRRFTEALGLPLVESDLDAYMRSAEAHDRELVLVTYGGELVRRCMFGENRLAYSDLGRGVLVLWHEVARDEHGRVANGFRLLAQDILNGQSRLAADLKEIVTRELKD